jgi:membrane protease YdiL (CAAX protease family)
MRTGAAAWRRWPTAAPWVLPAAGVAGLALATAAASAGGVGASTWLLWVLLLPLLEETVFRLGLQEDLLRRGLPHWLANGCTALCFTACHVLLRGASWASWAVLGPALLLGVVYGRSRQLRGCVALHALMNAGWIAAQQLAPV